MKNVAKDFFFASLGGKADQSRHPVRMTFELTYGCNLRCLHCYNPTHQALPQELSTTEVNHILDQVADIGTLHLTFTGGEPFVRPDFPDILWHARNLGFVLSVMSNSTRIKKPHADTLRDVGVENVSISIYGASQTIYERVTQIPGSFEGFIRGLKALARRQVPVTVRMPVLRENAAEVHEARALVEGFGFKFQYCLDIMPKNTGDLSPLAHRLSPAEKVRIYQSIMGYEGVSMADTSCHAEREFMSCFCGRSQFAITPYGEMNLCIGFPIPKYDLRKGTVKEGWEVLKKTVDEAKPNERYECSDCDVQPYCQQGRNDAWLETGNMSVCLPHFKELASLEQTAHEYLDPRRPV